MGLVLVNYGGNLNTGVTLGTPGLVIDEWSNSIAYIDNPAAPLTQARADFCASRVRSFINANASEIDQTVSLEYVKVNEYSVTAPYHQITDPTMQGLMTGPIRGGGASATHPTTTSYRVSMDDGTRNRRARGGFYVPRTSLFVGSDGRFSSVAVAACLNQAVTMLRGIETDTGWTLGVWSRKGGSVTAVTRIRIGDVPDNVSRRKDDMRESYQHNP